ncbi:MAG: murein L,D-transpeptidase catalytic domain family protein [Flavobacteriales bacterium]|nr:murein L,D-transpeptidase catalytic domain family protein [Flavobacteriales bacterium]
MKKRAFLFAALILLVSIVLFGFDPEPNPILMEKAKQEIKKYTNEFDKPQYAIIIDYDRVVWRKRLWVLDLRNDSIILSSRVSHAWKSGFLWANKFSNTPNSELSSIGTFKTLNSYESTFGEGKYKIGMRLKGLEKGLNDKVLQRNIVFHCHKSLWSAGCFMTPPAINKRIIDLTKNGNILFVHKSNSE